MVTIISWPSGKLDSRMQQNDSTDLTVVGIRTAFAWGDASAGRSQTLQTGWYGQLCRPIQAWLLRYCQGAAQTFPKAQPLSLSQSDTPRRLLFRAPCKSAENGSLKKESHADGLWHGVSCSKALATCPSWRCGHHHGGCIEWYCAVFTGINHLTKWEPPTHDLHWGGQCWEPSWEIRT